MDMYKTVEKNPKLRARHLSEAIRLTKLNNKDFIKEKNIPDEKIATVVEAVY